MEEAAGFFQSGKGKEKLVYGGYSYSVNKTAGETKYWRCCRYKERSCRATAKTVDGELVGDPSEYAPDLRVCQSSAVQK